MASHQRASVLASAGFQEAGKELSCVRGECRVGSLWRTFSKPISPPTASAAGFPSLPRYQNCLLLTVAFSFTGGGTFLKLAVT